MSMTVVPNPDGSYTVKCGEVEVTVGGGAMPAPVPAPDPTPDPDPDPDPWPEPDDNDGGAIAYLHVGRTRVRTGPFILPGTPAFPGYFEPPTFLIEAVPGANVALRGETRRQTLVVELHVPAGQAFDIDQLKAAAWRMRGNARRVALHVYVDVITPWPRGLPVENERL